VKGQTVLCQGASLKVMAREILENRDILLKNPMKGQAEIDNEVGVWKLAIKNTMNGQTIFCQDSPMNRAVDDNKIGRSSEENDRKK
jgi:hypothetical protein